MKLGSSHSRASSLSFCEPGSHNSELRAGLARLEPEARSSFCASLFITGLAQSLFRICEKFGLYLLEICIKFGKKSIKIFKRLILFLFKVCIRFGNNLIKICKIFALFLIVNIIAFAYNLVAIIIRFAHHLIGMITREN